MTLRYTLNKTSGFIFDYLTDMDKFASIHQMITRIDSMGDNRYLVHETVRLGIFPYSFTYPVSVESDAGNQRVTMRATVMRMTHILMEYTIREEAGKSTVEEIITFKSILPIKGVMEKLFREQHALLFRNMDNIK